MVLKSGRNRRYISQHNICRDGWMFHIAKHNICHKYVIWISVLSYYSFLWVHKLHMQMHIHTRRYTEMSVVRHEPEDSCNQVYCSHCNFFLWGLQKQCWFCVFAVWKCGSCNGCSTCNAYEMVCPQVDYSVVHGNIFYTCITVLFGSWCLYVLWRTVCFIDIMCQKSSDACSGK